MLRFVEPHPFIDNAYCETTLSEEAAIAHMKRAFPERQYTNEQALDDFIVVNWACEVTNT